VSEGLNVRSTTFPHKDIHKETWYLADGRAANHTGHNLISNRFKKFCNRHQSTKGTRHWIKSQHIEDKI
jgi:hypothetical protein